ncbi:MAG: hypothetical protein B6244_12980, partial [Candidatus Cloacimonetes bacterium 4572_55]
MVSLMGTRFFSFTRRALNGVLFAFLFLLFSSGVSWGAFSENFDSWADGSYGTTTDYDHTGVGQWQTYNSMCNSQNARSGNAIRFNDDSGQNEYLRYQGLDGNGKDSGIGTISFYYCHWDADGSSVQFQVQYNQSGGGWTNVGSVVTVTSTTYAQFSENVDLSGDDILVQVISIADAERLLIDDFNITDFVASSTCQSAGTGDWNTAGTWATCGGTFPQAGDNVQIQTGHTVTFNGDPITGLGTVTVDAGGTLATGGASRDLQGNSLTVNGTFRIDQGGWASNGTFDYNATGTLEFANTSGSYGFNNADAYWPSGATAPQNVNVSGSGLTMNAARTVAGIFETSSTVTTANNLTANGTLRLNSGGSLDSAPTYGAASLLHYNTGGIYGRSNEWDANDPHHVQLSNTTTLNYPNGSTAARTMTGNLTIDANSALHMNYGTPSLSNPLTVGGNVLLNGTLTLGDAAGGDLNLSGDWTFNTGATFTHNSRSVNFVGTTAQAIGGTGDTTFGYVTFNNANGVTAPAGIIGVQNNFTNTNGFTHNNGTVTFTGTSAQTVSGTVIFNNVSQASAGGVNYGASSTVNGTLTLNAGSSVTTNAPTYGASSTLIYNTGTSFTVGAEWFAAASGQGVPQNVQVNSGTTILFGAANRVASGSLTIDGVLTAPGTGNTLSIAGDLTNTGTFTHNDGSIILNGTDQTITGSFTFYDLTKTVAAAATLTFPASATQTIANALTLQGASGQLLSLRSSTPGTQWDINPQGTRTIGFLDVQDSKNTNATDIDATGSGFVDSGNNIKWKFYSWIINEILADPDATNGDANGDGSSSTTQDEFVEIINNTGGDVDISGWTLSDVAQTRHTFPGGTTITDQCAIVIFGGGTPTGVFGNATVQTASTNSLGFNNGGDTVTLSNGGTVQSVYTYGSEGGNNQSLTRNPDITGSFSPHSTATGSGGALFSPGTLIDGSSICSLTPNIAISSSGPTAGNVEQGATNHIMYQLNLAVTVANAEFTGLTVTTGGTYAVGDIVANSFKLYYSADNSLD